MAAAQAAADLGGGTGGADAFSAIPGQESLCAIQRATSYNAGEPGAETKTRRMLNGRYCGSTPDCPGWQPGALKNKPSNVLDLPSGPQVHASPIGQLSPQQGQPHTVLFGLGFSEQQDAPLAVVTASG